MANQIPQVDNYIDALSGEIQVLAARIRSLIFDTVPDVEEALKWGMPVYSLEKSFCYVKAATKHVNLGFDRGAVLVDPAGLLEGTGKMMRHVKLKPGQDIPEQELRRLIEQATTLV